MMQTFWAGGKYLGARQHPSVWVVDGFSPLNLAFCCPYCGDLWARITIDRPAGWAFRSRPCRNCPAHPDIWRPEHCGTLADPEYWNNSPLHFADDWPEDAIRWEFQSLLSTFTKGLS